MKKFVKKVFVFLFIIISLQFFISSVYPPDVPKNIRTFEKRLARSPDIVFLGDSVIHWTAPSDINKESLPKMLHDILPDGWKMSALYYDAGQMDLFFSIIKFVLKRHRPRLFIVSINLRSFSPVWIYRPEYQYPKDKFIYTYDFRPLEVFLKPLSVFKAFVPETSQEEYAEIKIFDGDRYMGKMRDFMGMDTCHPEDFRKIIIANYMYHLTEDNKNIVALQKMIRFLKAMDINVLFYITPLDQTAGQEFLGEPFMHRVRANSSFLAKVIEREGVEVLDLSLMLDGRFFCWRQEKACHAIDEHLDENGRAAVAQKLAEEILGTGSR